MGNRNLPWCDGFCSEGGFDRHGVAICHALVPFPYRSLSVAGHSELASGVMAHSAHHHAGQHSGGEAGRSHVELCLTLPTGKDPGLGSHSANRWLVILSQPPEGYDNRFMPPNLAQ